MPSNHKFSISHISKPHCTNPLTEEPLYDLEHGEEPVTWNFLKKCFRLMPDVLVEHLSYFEQSENKWYFNKDIFPLAKEISRLKNAGVLTSRGVIGKIQETEWWHALVSSVDDGGASTQAHQHREPFKHASTPEHQNAYSVNAEQHEPPPAPHSSGGVRVNNEDDEIGIRLLKFADKLNSIAMKPYREALNQSRGQIASQKKIIKMLEKENRRLSRELYSLKGSVTTSTAKEPDAGNGEHIEEWGRGEGDDSVV